jgi:hypothetical protein
MRTCLTRAWRTLSSWRSSAIAQSDGGGRGWRENWPGGWLIFFTPAYGYALAGICKYYGESEPFLPSPRSSRGVLVNYYGRSPYDWDDQD